MLLAASALAGTRGADARGLFVSTTGSDSNAGTFAKPWRKVATALGRLRAGDTLYVRAGKYFEAPTATVSGTAAAPIVVRAYPGETVTIDSGIAELETPGNAEWEPVNPAIGEYRTRRAYSGGTIYAYLLPTTAYENGRMALVPYVSAVSFRSTRDQYDTTGFYVGPGTFDDGDGRIHVRLAKTSDLIATESRYGPLLSGSQPSPASYGLVISRASHTLKVTGSYLTFAGLVLHQASNTIEIGAGAHHLRFENVTAWVGGHAFEAAELGIHHVALTQSRIYGDAPYWVFWSDMKDAPYPADRLRATSIDLRGGTHDVEVSWCHVRGSGQDLLGTNDAEYNLSIHHNRFENAGDDALELEGALGRTDVFENFFLNCLVAVAPGQDSPGFMGPLFVYRNVMAALRNPPVNRQAGLNSWNGGGRYGYEYMLKFNGSDNGTRNAHLYHNTMVMIGSAGRGMNLTPQNPQGTRVANNLLVTVNGPLNGTYLEGLDQVVDGDLYWKANTVDATHLVSSYDTVPALRSATGLEAHGLGSVSRRGTNPLFATWAPQVVDRTRTVWQLTAASEHVLPSAFLLGASSPARGAGIAIPPLLTGALPDSRTSRDIGAIPYGTSAAEYARFPFDPSSGGLVDVPGALAPPAVALAVRAIPNPTAGRAELRFSLPSPGPARLDLLDVQGRVVRTLLDRPWLAAGPHAVALDVRSGSPIPAGVYFCRLDAGDASARGRIVVVD